MAQWQLQEGTKHDIDIDVARARMVKGIWQSADNLETKFLPKMDRRFIGRNDKIKLHRAKAEPAGLAQAMLTHFSSYPQPARVRRNHEWGISDMRTGTRLICS